MKNLIFLIIKGIFVGVANIIPGVSGGTIAVVLGIFDEMIDAINNFFKNPKKHTAFLAPLCIGAVLGIVLLSKIIKWGLESFSLPTNMFFAGLVVGSIPLIYAKARENKVYLKHYLAAFISFFIVIAFVVLEKVLGEPEDGSTVVLSSDFMFLIKMFLGALVASSAMVIPGISGSFVMVLIGMYGYVINAISSFIDNIGKSILMIGSGKFGYAAANLFFSDSFKILCAVGIGVVLGIIVISRIISLLLKKAYTLTYFCVLGLIFGSLVSIFADGSTYQSGVDALSITAAAAALILGFIIAFKLGKE